MNTRRSLQAFSNRWPDLVTTICEQQKQRDHEKREGLRKDTQDAFDEDHGSSSSAKVVTLTQSDCHTPDLLVQAM